MKMLLELLKLQKLLFLQAVFPYFIILFESLNAQTNLAEVTRLISDDAQLHKILSLMSIIAIMTSTYHDILRFN